MEVVKKLKIRFKKREYYLDKRKLTALLSWLEGKDIGTKSDSELRRLLKAKKLLYDDTLLGINKL